MRSLAIFLVSLSYLSLAASEPSFYQVDRGGIVGLVTDPAGARVSGAQVKITNLAANQSSEVITDENGNNAADLLRVGSYSVTVEKAGFKKAVRPSVEVGINRTARVDFSLLVGSAAQTIEVTAAAPLVQTEASSLGTLETERRISQLPLNGRNFIQLAYLGPGANGGQTGSNVSEACSRTSAGTRLSRSMDFALPTTTSC